MLLKTRAPKLTGEGFRDEGLLAGLGGSGRGPLACRSFEKLGFLDAGGGGGAGLLLLLGCKNNWSQFLLWLHTHWLLELLYFLAKLVLLQVSAGSKYIPYYINHLHIMHNLTNSNLFQQNYWWVYSYFSIPNKSILASYFNFIFIIQFINLIIKFVSGLAYANISIFCNKCISIQIFNVTYFLIFFLKTEEQLFLSKDPVKRNKNNIQGKSIKP